MPVFRSALAAIALAVTAMPVSAQELPQLSEAEVNAVALYAMPHAFRALQARCATQLPGSAYIHTRGDALAGRLDQASRGRFPAARTALTRMVTAQNPQMAALLGQLPAENIEPLARELIAGKVQSEVQLTDCARYNRVLELLDPLPPENLASLMGVLVAEAQGRNRTAPTTTGTARR